MGSWTEAVYTKQQQTRLGVDAQGHKVRPAVHTTTSLEGLGPGELLQPQPDEVAKKPQVK